MLLKNHLSRISKIALIGVIRGYQRMVSPLIGPCCRHYPSCSQYVIDSVSRHGVLWGILRGLGRVLRCNPLFPGGYDPAH